MRAIAAALLLVPATARADWSGSEISLKHAAGVWSAIPGAELSHDPIVLQTVAIDPRWRGGAGSGLVFHGHLAAETELTDSDTSTRRHEPLLDDAWVEGERAIPGGAVASLRLALPTSRESWARRRLFSVSPAVVFARTLRAGPFVYHPFAGVRAAWHASLSDSAVYEAPSIAGCNGDGCQELTHSGIRSTLATFVERVGLTVELRPDLSATAEVWLVQGLLYPLAPVTLPDGETLPPGGTRWRFSNLYVLGAEWRLAPAWRVGAALETLSPQRAPDGSLRTPFFNRLTQLTFTVGRVF